MIIEVEDLAETRNPVSLSVHVFNGQIPIDRKTENRAEYSVHSVYSIYKNYLDLNEMSAAESSRFFVSVRCETAPVRFRIVAVLVQSELDTTGHTVSGEVCPGGWIYHHLNFGGVAASEDGHRRLGASSDDHEEEPQHIRFEITKYTGSLYTLARFGFVPVKLVPPYLDMVSSQHHVAIEQCNVTNGEYYLGILGGDICANSDVKATVFTGDCTELPWNGIRRC